MAKKRVYEIARERGLESKQVIRRLHAAGVDVKAPASTVSDEDIARVFGAPKESVAPAKAKATGLPSWLDPTASKAPKTTSKAAIEQEREARDARKATDKAAKEKAIEKARRLRQQLAAKKAAQAQAAAKREAGEEEPEVVEAPPVEEVPVEEPVSTDELEAPVTEVAGVEIPQVEGDEPATALAAALAAAARSDEAKGEAAETTEPDAESVVEDEVVPAAQPEAVEQAEEEQVQEEPKELSEAEKLRRAREIAQQRVGELAARRRAQLEAEKLEEEQRSRDRDGKKKDKKKKKKGGAEEPETPETPEFIGSRRSKVGDSRGQDDRGERRGPRRKRRVVIDSGASRKGGADAQRGKGGRKGRRGERDKQVEIDPTVPVSIHAGATVKELSDALHVASTELIKILMMEGDFVTITQSLTQEQIELVGVGLDPPRDIVVRSASDEEIPVFEDPDEALVARAPVVTIIGHVDHGKTSLLDAIRKTKVAAGEAGGITQHIGAYQVDMPDGRKVTFLDTPGHEAFTALRARGAKVTDEAVLVVAADDGVKPQTIEAIDHARAAGVPILVAINKIDKENAQPDRVKGELAQHDLQPEEWGGKTVMVEVSALQRQNLDELIEMILLQADILELKANPNADASGYIIESRLDPGRGPVCTLLVDRGTLRVGDVVIAGAAWGKVKALHDFTGGRVDEAGPAMPVEILGFDSVPDSGEFCTVVATEREARERAQKMAIRVRAESLARRQGGMSLEDLFARIKEGVVNELNLIVKADVRGSIEAIEQELSKISHDEVKIRIIHTGVGGITQSDVMLASASRAIILGFNVRPNSESRITAEREGVDIRNYSVIYKLREDVEAALGGLLSPEEVEETLGEAEVRQVFKASRIGQIAGCYVTDGKIERGAKIRLLRDGTVIHDGTISSLKRFKEDAKEVAQGYECGIAIDNFNDVKEGDTIEAYVVKQVERDLSKELERAAR